MKMYWTDYGTYSGKFAIVEIKGDWCKDTFSVKKSKLIFNSHPDKTNKDFKLVDTVQTLWSLYSSKMIVIKIFEDFFK